MSGDKVHGITYYPQHIYKILRKGYKKGGGAIISPKDFDEIVIDEVFFRSIIEYSDCLPSESVLKSLETDDCQLQTDKLIALGFRINKKEISNDAIYWGFRINRFFKAHGPSAPLAIGAINTIIGMERFGLTDCRTYFRLLERLDAHPAGSFTEFVRIVTEFEKEMK